MRVTTILYHDVVEEDWSQSGFPGEAANRYKLLQRHFDEHVAAIAALPARRAVCASEAIAAPAPGQFLFTVDDGGACSCRIADRLEALGWRGHFFITTDMIGKPGFASHGDIRDLHLRGHEIGSHSCSHPDWMSELPDARLDAEWRRSTACLADVIGAPVTSASTPGGYYAPRVAERASAAGISVLFNSEPTTAVTLVGPCHVLGRFTIRRGDPACYAAALIEGVGGARARQQLAWAAKRWVKRHARPVWERARGMAVGTRR